MFRIASSVIHRLKQACCLAPATFARLAAHLVPRFALSAVLLVAVALAMSALSAAAPEGAGDPWLLNFLHAPATWTALFLYVLMAAWAALAVALRSRLPALMMLGLAPTGAMFSAVALLTGLLLRGPEALWWGWDATLATQALLLLVYAAVMALHRSGMGPGAIRVQAALVLIGALNLPIVFLALRWWSALEPESAAALAAARSGAACMFAASVLLALAFWTYANAVILARVRRMLGEAEPGASFERPLDEA